jgi:hypothetical protein
MKRTAAGVLCLLLAGCRPDAAQQQAPSPSPSSTYVVLGPVRFPLPHGWANLGSSCPTREVMLVGPPDLACVRAGRLGPAIWAGVSKGRTGQSHVGVVAGHPVHLGRYDEERSSEIVVSFDDADYVLVIYIGLDRNVRRADRAVLEHLLSTLVDA